LQLVVADCKLSPGRSWRGRNNRKADGIVLDMTDGVAVWDGPGVECPVVVAGAPTVVFLVGDV
jgi:hypothetical protein